jgi:hypothetical protein
MTGAARPRPTNADATNAQASADPACTADDGDNSVNVCVDNDTANSSLAIGGANLDNVGNANAPGALRAIAASPGSGSPL